MQTIKRGKDFTGNVIGKCRNGHTTRYSVGKNFFNTIASLDDRRPCGTDGCDRVLTVRNCKPQYGSYSTETICDGRCMGATGQNCDCQCGGMNHGGKWAA